MSEQVAEAEHNETVPMQMQPHVFTYKAAPRLEVSFMWTASSWRDKTLVFRIRSMMAFPTTAPKFINRFTVNFHTDGDVGHLTATGLKHGATPQAKLALIRGAGAVALSRMLTLWGETYTQWEKLEDAKALRIAKRKAKNM